MPYRFIDSNLKNIIITLIDEEFPNMGTSDLNIIKKYFISFVEVLSHMMHFQQKPFSGDSDNIININKMSLLKNNNLYLRWLVTYIIPHISDKNGKYHKDIKSLQEVYVEKLEQVDINTTAPKYVYSNIQYGRCVRDDKKDIKEISFSEKHIRDNYFLLIDTLKDCSNKMHVNWRDIFPYSTDYTSSNLFIKTNQKYRAREITDWDPYTLCDPSNLENNSAILELTNNTSGLDVGVMYDTISNLLYDYILPIKWMIYDIPVLQNSNISRIPLLSVLNNCLELNSIIGTNHRKYWENIDNDSRRIFTGNWERFKNILHSKGNIQVPADSYVVTSDNFAMMAKSLLIGFNFGYTDIQSAVKKNYKPFKKTREMELIMEYEDERLTSLDISFFIESVDSMPPESLYDYLVDSIHRYKSSWLYDACITEKSNVYLSKMYMAGVSILNGVFRLHATVKNFYNYFKSMVHTGNGKNFVRLPKRWKSLDNVHKLEFIDKLKLAEHEDAPTWFSVKKYIKTYIYEPNSAIKSPNADTAINIINNRIYHFVNSKVIDIIFIALIRNGILTYFKASDFEASDLNNNGRSIVDIDTVFKTDASNNFWSKSYHYLTNRPFCDTGKYKFKINDAVIESNIFDHYKANKHSRWYERVSMDWIAQLGLCHKLVHQRVHFITGGTGIGKTSVIPILYMYYQKALDYNMAGSVVCTIPRVQPTQETVRNSSAQLGLPVTIDDREYNDTLYNIQMSHQKKKHISDGEYLKLKFCTDGSLLMDLNNPMLKKFTDRKRSKYRTNNMYDVIIVDEAHEHNANMDIILSIMRNIAHHNNAIKIVIMSATIDDDEPAYRRFYRNINDNRKYPLCRWIETHEIDRINIDRRLHVAKPGADTPFYIDDIYVPDQDADKLVCKIMNETQSGYGLLFRPGRADIDKSVQYINDNTSPNIIALPYYAKLENTAKELVKNIDKSLPNLRIAKTDDLNEMGHRGELDKGSGKYDRCVIVATNIAEASITIDNLTAVFETGQQKKQIYDYRVRSATLQTKGITESSRLQRRGRVGRTGPGKAYYLYAKDTMKYNRFLFDISVSDQSMNLLSILQDTYSEKPFIDIDINNSAITMSDIKKLGKGYDDILWEQYFIMDEYYNYFGNTEYYDYHNYRNCAIFGETGYKFHDIIDSQGQFYVIHPDELQFSRNLNGEITGVSGSDVELLVEGRTDNKIFNRIKSKKMESFMDNLLKSMLLAYNGNHTVKTSIGRYIHSIHENLQQSGIESIYDTLMLIYSAVFDNTDDMIRYISLKSAIGADLRKLFVYYANKRRLSKSEVQNLVPDSHDSDIVSLIKLTKILDTELERLKIPTTFKAPEINITDACDYDDACTKTLTTILELEKGDTLQEFIKKSEVDDGNIDYRTTGKEAARIFSQYVDNVVSHIDGLLEQSEQFNSRMQYLGINSDSVVQYYKNYNMLMKHIILLQVDNPSRNSITLAELGDKLRPIKGIARTEDAVTHCLLLSKPYNIIKHITNTSNKYIDVFNPSMSSLKSYASLSKFKFMPSSLMDDANIKSYMYYDTYNITTNEISICHRLKPHFLSVVSHVFSLFDINLRHNKTMDKKIEDYDNDDVKAMLNYGRTFKDIYGDLSTHKSYVFWSILPQIDTALTEYAETMEEYEKYGRITLE